MILAAPLVALLAAAGAHPAFASRLREPAPDARVAPGVVAADVAVARASAPPAPLQDDALSDGSRISDVRDDVLASDAPIAPAAGVGAAPQKGVRGSAAAAEDGLLRDRGVDVEEAVSAEEGLSWGGRPSECAKHVNGWTYFSSDMCRGGYKFTVYARDNTNDQVLDKPQALTKVKDQASKGDLDWNCNGAGHEGFGSNNMGDVSIGSTEKGKNIAASFLETGRVCWYYGTGGAGEEAWYRWNFGKNRYRHIQTKLIPADGKTYVLDNYGGVCAVGRPIKLYHKVAGHANQEWNILFDGRIEHAKCGLYLEYTGDDCAVQKLVLGNGNKNPGWTYEDASDVDGQDQVFIKNKCSTRDMVLDVGGGVAQNGQDIYLYPKHWGTNQQWYGVYQ